MTSRQAGQKIGRMYANRTGYRNGRQKTAMPAAQKRRLAQFLICGTIFVLLVAAKLLIRPGSSGSAAGWTVRWSTAWT